MIISTNFVTYNQKVRLKRSKTYAEGLKSGQAQDCSSYGENAMNLEAIKKYLLNSESFFIIPTFPPELCTNTSSPDSS